MSPKFIGIAIDAAVGLVVLAIVIWLGRGLLGYVQAPAKLEAAIGNNAALKAGAEAQNKGVDGLQAASKAKIEKSAAAAKEAGKPEFAAAKRVTESKAPGATPLERAANRINAEFPQ
jgi:hypothetical protein